MPFPCRLRPRPLGRLVPRHRWPQIALPTCDRGGEKPRPSENSQFVSRHILVLDTPAGDLETLLDAFASVCGDGSVERAPSRDELFDRIGSGEKWDLVVLDADLGDGATDGRAVLAELRALEPLVPVVVVAESGDV